MPIASRSIVSVKPHSGRFRVRFLYVLDDGRERRYSTYATDLGAANAKLAEFEPRVLLSVQRHDAEKAASLGVQAAYKEATQGQVMYAWLKAAFNSDEPYQIYDNMKDVVPALIAMGLSNEQHAAAMGCEVGHVVKAKALWASLKDNAAAISSYKAIVL